MKSKLAIRIVISVVLFGIILSWVDLGQVWESMMNADIFYISIAFLIATADRIFMPMKWNLLLRARGIQVSWFDATAVYYTSSFLGLFLPPTVGADTIRAYLVSKKRYSLTDIIPSILVERLLGAVALLLFGILGCLIFVLLFATVEFDIENLLWSIVIFSILITGGFVYSLSDSFKNLVFWVMERFSSVKYIGKFTRKFEKLYLSYQEYRSRKGALALFFTLSCLENILPIVRPYVIALAMGVNVPIAYFFVLIPIVLVLIRLPISFDGFGVQEGAFVFFLSLVGISQGVAFSVGLVNHLVFLLAILPGGIFYAFNRGLKAPDLEAAKTSV